MMRRSAAWAVLALVCGCATARPPEVALGEVLAEPVLGELFLECRARIRVECGRVPGTQRPDPECPALQDCKSRIDEWAAQRGDE